MKLALSVTVRSTIPRNGKNRLVQVGCQKRCKKAGVGLEELLEYQGPEGVLNI